MDSRVTSTGALVVRRRMSDPEGRRQLERNVHSILCRTMLCHNDSAMSGRFGVLNGNAVNAETRNHGLLGWKRAWQDFMFNSDKGDIYTGR